MTVFGGDIIYAADINYLAQFSSQRPVGRMIQAVAQTGIVNNTMTAVTFTTEVYDNPGFHSNSVNNSRVTPSIAGLYEVSGTVSIAGQTDYTSVETVILRNGSAQAPATRITTTTTSTTLLLPVSCKVDCNGSSDYFELGFRLVRSGAGTSGTTSPSSQFSTVLEWQLARESP